MLKCMNNLDRIIDKINKFYKLHILRWTHPLTSVHLSCWLNKFIIKTVVNLFVLKAIPLWEFIIYTYMINIYVQLTAFCFSSTIRSWVKLLTFLLQPFGCGPLLSLFLFVETSYMGYSNLLQLFGLFFFFEIL